jgi:hypothetical protein
MSEEKFISKEDWERVNKKNVANIIESVKNGKPLTAAQRKLITEYANIDDETEEGAVQAELVVQETTSLIESRQNEIEAHYAGGGSLSEQLASTEGSFTAIMDCVMYQMAGETDKLVGNERMLAKEGSLRDASVVSAKRIEGLERIGKMAQVKSSVEKDMTIDLDSPSIKVFWEYFLGCVNDVMIKMDEPVEAKDTFFRIFADRTVNWKKELKELLNQMRQGNG